MLDTNVVSELMRDPRGYPKVRIAELGEAGLAVSIIVAAELRYGAAKRGSERIERQVELVLSRLIVAPFEPPADSRYAMLRDYLRRVGKPIGSNDQFIAAHAIALGVPLVTANFAEFERVPDLRVIRWR